MSDGVDRGRYCLEDTMLDLPAVTVRPGRDGVLSPENLEAAGYRVVVRWPPPDCKPPTDLVCGELHVDQLQIDACVDGHDTRTYNQRTDARLDALGLTISKLFERIDYLTRRVDRLEGRSA